MTATHKTTFLANPLQRQFIESRAAADLFSSRMGEGKSTALAWAALYHTRHNPGASWAIIRDTWENLQGTTMKTFFEWFPPGIFGEWVATRKTFTWASGVAQGDVVFMGMDDPADASKLMSRELAGFGIDEPAPAVGSAGVDETIFDIAMTRLRQGGMGWYGAKLAENNPDESHWTYKRFVDPGDPEFRIWQPPQPENEKNLPSDYYVKIRKALAHRPDLIRRFVEGDFGFQQLGRAVTPQWSDRIHLGHGLTPVGRSPLILMWDWGHNPTCVVGQITPLGNFLILDSMVGSSIGAEELIEGYVRPLLVAKYPKFELQHIGDPAGNAAEQTSIHRTPVRMLKRALGGTWRSGPVRWEARIEPLQALLSRTSQGRGVLQVDRHNAKEVWHALRGGWHYPVHRSGLVAASAFKDIHSHPGDALSYGVATLFPLGKLRGPSLLVEPPDQTYFDQRAGGLHRTRGPRILPEHGASPKESPLWQSKQ